MTTNPSLSHALLVTDVVDSTKLAEQLGDAATAALWARHDRVARDLLRPHRGREIDKTDGFLLLFDRADDAVAYALAYHRAIAELGLKARAGLHVGPVILTENTPQDVALGAKPLEVDGLAKPTAARVMSLALGGQTLLTADARAALGPTGLRVASHGHWRLKGVAEPLELFEVGEPGAPFAPPPDGAKAWRVVQRDGVWLPARDVPHHLPAERDAFVGRAEDLRTLADLLETSRLVSVLGLGGTGKTRLVTRFAWTWLGDFPGGAWFCDLADARSVDGICAALAKTLDVPLGKDDPVLQLGHALAARGACLVVVDNFEQVARHAAETLGPWLDRARDARFVVTTREVLGMPGESALALAPLAGDEAIGLFVTRARQTKPDFAADDEASIRALVALLDGLPLAIELAAARVRVMPPKMLLERMSQRFKLLASTGARHTRQATLRGALDWSWDLLSPDEQAALAQLSVFEGGFTLEAAEAVLALADLWPTDAVQALVDKSLVRHPGDDRFVLLVSVQEYAAEKLDALGGRAGAEERHAAWFARLGEEDALRALETHGGAARRRALAHDLDNCAIACRRSAARGDGERAASALRAAWAVLAITGPVRHAIELADLVVAMPGLSPRDLAHAHGVRGGALSARGAPNEARPDFEANAAYFRSVGDIRREAAARAKLGGILELAGRSDEALEHWRNWLAVARTLGDRVLEGLALNQFGNVAKTAGRPDEAQAYYESALAAHRDCGDRRSEGIAMLNLGNVYGDRGLFDQARALHDGALAIARETGDHKGECHALSQMAVIEARLGHVDAARERFVAVLEIARRMGDRPREAYLTGSLGILAAMQGRPVEARAQFEASLALYREVGDRRKEGDLIGDLGYLHWTRGEEDEARAHIETALAIAREVGDLHAQVVRLGRLADLCRRLSRLDEARMHIESGLALAREVGDPASEGARWLDQGALHLQTGDLTAARTSLAEAERLIRQVGSTSELARLRAFHAILDARAGDLQAARAALEEAEAITAGIGARPLELVGALAEARAALGTP